MEDSCGWKIGGLESSHALPSGPVPLAATPKRTPPEFGYVVAKRTEAARVGRHRVVRKVATYHLTEPLALLTYWPMHTSPQFSLDGTQPKAHAVPTRLPHQQKTTGPTTPTDVREEGVDQNVMGWTRPTSLTASNEPA